MAAKVALGYTLTEIRNDITGASACAEPALDYVVVKMPRWPFDKFRDVDHHIGMTMKSTGEVMAIGRSFEQAFSKALRSLDTRSTWLEVSPAWTSDRITSCLADPTHERPAAIYNAIAQGWSIEKISEISHIHPWFIERLAVIYRLEQECRRCLTPQTLAEAKRMGFSDEHLASLRSAGDGYWALGDGGVVQHVTPNAHHLSPIIAPSPQEQIRSVRSNLGIKPTYKMVDTCAGEFAASTPYFYSSYEQEDEADALPGPKVIVLGSGPIRIGQGIEFDYSSVHAVETLRQSGVKAVVINNNPETVSTDYHLSDRLYFEPLSLEEVLNVVEHEQDGLLGVIAQFGGQTALNLIRPLAEAGVTILGTSPESIAATENREEMAALCERLGIPTPAWTIAHSQDELEAFAPQIGFPVLVRPSYVLGGRGMKIIRAEDELRSYLGRADAGPAQTPYPDRSLPRGRHRDRRRRRVGRPRHLHGGHGTARQSGSTFGRQHLRLPPADPLARSSGARAQLHPQPRAGAARYRPDQRAVRGQRRAKSICSKSTHGPRALSPSPAKPPECPWPAWPPA